MKKLFTLACLSFFIGNIQSQTVFDFSQDPSTTILQTFITNNTTYPSGSVIILNNSLVYNVNTSSNATIAKSFTVMGDSKSAGKPVIKIGAARSFQMSNGGAVDSIKFVNVKIAGVLGSTLNTSGYFFNNSGSNVVTIGKLIIDSCEVRTLRGFFRLRAAGSVLNKAIINHSIFDSIGGYNVLTAEDAVIKDIVITNSTFVNNERLIRTTNSTTPAGLSDNLEISNCTFVRAPKKGSILIDYGTGSISGTKSISNCIFGPVWQVTVGDTGTIAAPTTIGFTLNNNYRTSELIQLDSAAVAITRYNKICTELFKDTVVSTSSINLTIKDATFAAATSAGDPRWYYSNSVKANELTIVNSRIIVTSDNLILPVTAKKVLIYSISGQMIKSFTSTNMVNISDFKKGIYLVRYNNLNNETFTQKFVK